MKITSFIILAPLLLFVACEDSPVRGGGEPESQPQTRQTLSLDREVLTNAEFTFAEAAAMEISEWVSTFGDITLNTDKMAYIVSKVEGEILDDLKQLGDVVKAGEIVARIESQSLASSIVRYLKTEQEQQFTLEAYLREKELFSKKLTSSAEFYEAERAYKRAQIEHAAALQPLELLHFSEGQLHGYLGAPDQATLTILEVVSPIDGIITRKSLIKGQAVQADAELYVVADLSEVWIDFQVPLAAANDISTGDQVKVGLTRSDITGTATVKYVAPLANEINRTVQVRATLPNSEGIWRPGSPVNVQFARDPSTAEVAIPAEALLDFEGGFAVFVKKGQNTFELRNVVPGKSDGSHVAIEHGLELGETVVSSNAYLLKAQWQMESES